MIVPVIGAPGTGKTTVCRGLTQRYGTPHFEMSWMPEFMRRNGLEISYAEDERLAVEALLAVAQIYSDAGHHVVLISDFRNEVLPFVMQHLAKRPHRIVRLYSSTEAVLAQRVMDPTRPSGYRDVSAAQEANRAIRGMEFGDSFDIDVAAHDIEGVLDLIRDAIVLPNRAA